MFHDGFKNQMCLKGTHISPKLWYVERKIQIGGKLFENSPGTENKKMKWHRGFVTSCCGELH